jgi:hypothetical protein
MNTSKSSVLASTVITPYEAAVRLGWSDSVQSLPSHTRLLTPLAVTARDSYIAIKIDLLAGDVKTSKVELSQILSYGELD